tara:strand:- start:532 stop:1059 length:528 start_codon:yes stop_codon:yes gene_type:complete
MSKNELQKIWKNEIGLPYREKVEKLQDYFFAIAKNEVEKPDFIENVEVKDKDKKTLYPSWTKYKHYFSDGLYVREISCPKDKMLFSVIHKAANPLFLLSGKILISTEDGSEELTGPMYLLTEPGVKRVILVLEDIKVVTVHPNPTGTRNLEEIESQLFACEWEEYDMEISKDTWL